MRASVIGSGSFGTALSNVLAVNGTEVRLWGRDPALAEAINTRHENPTYLPGIELAPNVLATVDLAHALEGSSLVVMAAPSHATRGLIAKALPFLPRGVPILTVAKGIENGTLLTMTEVLEDCLPPEFHPFIAVLSGPSFAKELAQRMPTVVTIASKNEEVAKTCQRAFQTETFRPYVTSDVVGVQYGGALKNVIAIAAGMADGMGMGLNARSAIITRGLAEISRIAVHQGAHPLTLSGLSGMGDLVLTCTGELSRNRRVGVELGRGRALPEILAEMKEVAEGVKTAQSAKGLSEKTGVELPICTQVYCIAHEGKAPRVAVAELMARVPRTEH